MFHCSFIHFPTRIILSKNLISLTLEGRLRCTAYVTENGAFYRRG